MKYFIYSLLALALVTGLVVVDSPNTASAACSISGDDLICGNADDTVTVPLGEIWDEILLRPGEDVLTNYGIIDLVNAGLDDDTIINNNFINEIYGHNGDDEIINNWIANYISGGVGHDDITNNATVNGSIYGDGGDDEIFNYGGVWGDVSGDIGEDYLYNYGWILDDLSGGDGYDELYNYGIVVDNILGGLRDDYIYNASGATANAIWAGEGHDTVWNWGDVEFAIGGGVGNDYIYQYGSAPNTWAGDGNDNVFIYEYSWFDVVDGGSDPAFTDVLYVYTANAVENGPTEHLYTLDCSIPDACPASATFQGHTFYQEDFEFIQIWN